jgi:hypothetical protein
VSERFSHSTVKLTLAYAGMIMRAAYASGRIGRDPDGGVERPEGAGRCA